MYSTLSVRWIHTSCFISSRWKCAVAFVFCRLYLIKDQFYLVWNYWQNFAGYENHCLHLFTILGKFCVEGLIIAGKHILTDKPHCILMHPTLLGKHVINISLKVMYQSNPSVPIPHGPTPGLLTIFENMRQIPGGGDKKHVKMPRSGAKNQ